MGRLTGRGMRLVGVLWGVLMLAGCATTGQRINPLYQPMVYASGGSGKVVLVAREGRAPLSQNVPVRWVLGSVVTEGGTKSGEITSDIAPADLLLDALEQELSAAGYTVSVAGVLPPDVPQGIEITKVTITIKEVSSVLKAEANGVVGLSADIWKKGTLVDRVSFESRNSDFAVKDRDLLLPSILLKGLQNVMKQAVPVIIKSLGK